MPVHHSGATVPSEEVHRELPCRRCVPGYVPAHARGEDDITGVSMDTLLHRQCLELLRAETVEDFVGISAEFGRSMGSHSMDALAARMHSPEPAEVHSVTDTPPDYRPIFGGRRSRQPRSGVSARQAFLAAIIRSQDTCTEAGQRGLWKRQAAAASASRSISLAAGTSCPACTPTSAPAATGSRGRA